MNIFTNNDYRRIQAWLKANAIKDSDFAISENTEPDEDVLVITQNMSTVPVNYKIKIKDLLNSSLGKVVIDKITSNVIKVNNTLTVDASKVILNNEKGTTLQNVFDYFEGSKLNRHTDDTFDGNLIIKKSITIEGNIKSHDGTTTVEADLKATGEITDGHSNQLNDVNSAAKNWKIEYQDPAQDEPTVRAKYVLRDYKGVPKGNVIKVYKDSAITNVYLGTTEDTCNPDTGEVTKKPIHDNNEALSIVYRLDTGKYMLVNVPIGIFTREAEFDKYRGLGIESNGQVFIKLASDVESTNYLHFNSLGELAADGIEDRILRDLGNIITSIAGDGTMWGVYKEHEGTQETSTSNDGSRWGEFKRAEEIREQISDSAHTVFSDNWDAQDDDPELPQETDFAEEASYAYNWKTTDTPASNGATQGNLKDLYNKTLETEEKVSELDRKINGFDEQVFTITGKRYTTNGNIISDSGCTITELLPLSAFNKPKQNGIHLKDGQFRMYGEGDYCVAVFFDNEKLFIGFSQLGDIFSSVAPFPASAIPSDAVYIAFSSLNEFLPAELITIRGIAEVVEKHTDAIATEETRAKGVEETILGKVSELDRKINGYASKLFTTLGQRYTTDGSLISDSGVGTTDIIPLSIFGDYKNNGIRLLSGTFRMYHEGNYCLAVFFDSAKTFVGFSQYGLTLSSVTPFPSSEIPSNAEYIAFSGLVTSVTSDLFDVEFVVYNKGVVGDVYKVKVDIVDINNSLVSTNESLEKLRKDVDNGFGGVLVGFDVFNAENVFTIKGKARNKDTGEEYDYTYANISPLMYLGYLRNSSGDIELIKGEFRGSDFGVAFFYNAKGEYIGYDDSRVTYSSVTPFPSSLIPLGSVYVSFLQYDNQESVVLYTYNKPISKYNELKNRLGFTNTYPVVVTPNMTPEAFYQAVEAQMSVFAEKNKTYSHSFLSILAVDYNYTWENVLSIVSKNLRQYIGDVNTPMNIICENVNKALTERVYRFYDAKPLSSAERDASLTTGLNKGEPSVIVSDDGGTMHIYGNGQRISTKDGVSWTSPVNIVKSDDVYTLHESVNYIDGVYYLIGPRLNFGGDLVLYTSSDGINFEYKGKLFLASTILDGEHPVESWGNPYLIKNYGDGKFYLYIETQEPGFTWRIHLVIFDDFSTENVDGTIGLRTIYEGNPVIQRPFGALSGYAQSAGNPDFFKVMDNRPLKVGNKYFMMFHSTHRGVAHLFRASSYDLIHWDIDGIMWDNRDRPSGGDETSGNADACIIEFKGRTYLFYTHDINQPESIEHIKYTIDDRPLSELLKLFP